MRRGLKVRKDVTGEELFEALQKLRYEISAREYVASSALFSDGTLRDLCRILPRTKKQLASVEGMGLFKANKYGDQILHVIRLYSPDTGTKKITTKNKPANSSVPGSGSFAAYKNKVITNGSTEAYQPWTKEEDQQLIREYENGISTKELSDIHKRTQGAIRSRLKKLGKI